ncbi:MAG TPA: ubiquinol-cytochrome c reductase iron-sulfur subunit [candidate division Zixibacteria bacterium]|nr:ubiquinol-cytochrome c reductase iron-sulfur subunit [candidate division Zixibacteria bacterium]
MAESKTSRRGFLEILLGGGLIATLGAVLYPIWDYLVPPAVTEAKLSQLKLPYTRAEIEAEPKKAKYFKYGRDLGIIFINEKDKLAALSAICTHLQCTVQNRPDLGLIWCACHNGKYSYTGANISGPPPKPLAEYQVKQVGDVIYVSQEAG